MVGEARYSEGSLHAILMDCITHKRHNIDDTNEDAEVQEYDVFESSDDENDDEPWKVTLLDDYNVDFGDAVSVISKVRAIAKVLRKSPLKNTVKRNMEKDFLCSWIPKLDGTHCSRCSHNSWRPRHLLTIH